MMDFLFFFLIVCATLYVLALVVLTIIGSIRGIYYGIKAARKNPHPIELAERFTSLNAFLLKFSGKERLAKFFRLMRFVIALVVSLDIILFAITFCKDDIVILRLCIFASILFAIYSCKKLYSQI